MDEKKLNLTEMRPLKTLSLYDLLAKKRREHMQKHTEQTHYAKDQKNSKRSPIKQTAQRLKKEQ